MDTLEAGTGVAYRGLRLPIPSEAPPIIQAKKSHFLQNLSEAVEYSFLSIDSGACMNL